MSDIIEYDKSAISERLRTLRKLHKLTQDDLAQKLYVHRSTVIKWEKPDKDELPTLDDMLRLCNLYGCELSYLLCEQECTTKTIQGVVEYTGLSEEAVKELHRFALSDKGASHNAYNRMISSGYVSLISSYVEKVNVPVQILRRALETQQIFEDEKDKEALKVLMQLQLLKSKEMREEIRDLFDGFVDDYTEYRETEKQAEALIERLTEESDRTKNIQTISLEDI